MKKYVAVFDGFSFSESAMLHAVRLAKEDRAHLVGLFADDEVYRSYNMIKVIKSYDNYEEKLREFDLADDEKRSRSVDRFEAVCRQNDVSFSVHRDKGIAIQEVKHESIFADLMVISELETFSKYKESSPTRFMKELLANVQCPVLVVPAHYKPVEKLVLLYDGSPSSVYATKMLCCTLSSSLYLPLDVLTVNSDEDGDTVPDQSLIKEFIHRHFAGANYIVKKGKPEHEILNYLKQQSSGTMVVLGAYRRTETSRWFKESMADLLLRELDLPLFISHNK